MILRQIAAAALVSLAVLPLSAAGAQTTTESNRSDESVSDSALVKSLPGFKEGTATVNGVRVHYVEGGKGSTVFLLPGWPSTWWEYHKIMPELAKSYHVVSIDLRGMGASERPAGGYDKKTMAADVAALAQHLGQRKIFVVGHDIGSMVAFSFAANYPQMTRKLVMLDVAHPDSEFAKWPMLPGVGTFGDKVGDGSNAYPWWFAYHQVKGLPEELGANGGIAKEQKWFFHYLTKNDASIDARDRAVYAAAYSTPEAIRAGDAWYQAFPQDVVDDAGYSMLKMPVLALGGPGYSWLKGTLPRKASDVEVVRLTDSGHFIPEEVPDELTARLKAFLN